MIVIATPTAADSVTTAFVKTLLTVRSHLQGNNIPTRYVNAIGSDLVTNRNFLASKALEDPAASHVLFIDSDMAFDGSVVDRLISAGKPVVGCVYPRKQLDLAAVEKRLATPGTSLSDAIADASSYVVQPLRPAGKPVNGLVPVAAIGMGAALIRRQVLETMVETGAARRVRQDQTYRSMGLTGPAYDFFSLLRNEDGDLLSEDYSFCRRWRVDCGGEVTAITDAAIAHVGPFSYAASYQRHLERRAPQLSVTLKRT